VLLLYIHIKQSTVHICTLTFSMQSTNNGIQELVQGLLPLQ